MSTTDIIGYNETAASNTDLDGLGVNQNPATTAYVDNWVQSLMSHLAKFTGADTIASAATTDLSTLDGRYVTVTGTTTITSFGTVKAGWIVFLTFSGALTLTHNATTLILPGAANITTSAGDTMAIVSEGSGNWRCFAYQYASGGGGVYLPLAGGAMTGNLTIDSASSAQTILDKGASGDNSNVVGKTAGVTRWLMALGNGTAESGSDAGSNFGLVAYDDAGSVIGTVFFVTRATGIVKIPYGARITPRVTSITSSATPTINTDNCDAVDITALATGITSMTTNLSGTPENFDVLIFRIKDDGTARAITWGASFADNGVALPTTTVISKLLTVGFIWNGSTWGCVSSASEA